ncbi:YfiR family protein [Alteromonadaceae bacterium BrNp21-10]|nr:YfiR family protein [Alteromonadaceae bacterium BrNp21-10]
MNYFFRSVSLLLFSSLSALAFAADREPYQIRAPLLLHILNYTTFTSNISSSFNLCFLEKGDYPHASMLLSSKISDKHVDNKLLNVIKINSIEQILLKQCQAVFIAKESESELLFSTLNTLATDILFIGESNHFVEQGGMMAIVSIQSKMKIIVNKVQLEKSLLKISSRLLRLAKFI